MAEESYNNSKANNQQSNDEGINFQDLLYLCVKNWYWFLISLLIALSLGVMYITMTQPVYTRQASLLIRDDDKNQSISRDFGQFSSMGAKNSRMNLHNEMITLKSPTYMIDVVKKLHLDVNYEIDGAFHKEVLYGSTLPVTVNFLDVKPEQSASFIMKLLDDSKVQLSDFYLQGAEKSSKPITSKLGTVVQTPIGKLMIAPTNNYIGKFDKKIYVTRGGYSGVSKSYSSRLRVDQSDEKASVVDLRFDDVSPERAEDVLNNLFVVYNEKWIEDINQQAISTSNFIDEELRQIERELGNVDENISSYKSQHMVPDVQAASSVYMARSENTSSQLLDLKNQLYMAKYIRRQLGNTGKDFSVLPANSGIDNPSVAQQIADYNEKVIRRNNLLANSNPSNPLVQDLDQELIATKNAITAAIDNTTAVLNERISSLQGTESQTRQQIASNPTQAKDLLSVERQQKVKEQLYVFLLQKREENQLSKAFTAYNTKLLNPPSGSMKPSKPVKFNVMLVALLLGILIPLIILLIMNSFDTAVRSRRDLEGVTVPFIGEIPLSYKKHRGILALFNRRKDVREIVVKEKSGNVINEAFRVVRTNLEFISGKEGASKIIMFTSANAGSGKTFISTNLALSFAIKKKRVLLIDLDLRKASMSTFVKSPTNGVSDYLSEHYDNLDDVMVKGELNEYLDVMPVGTIPPNPTELLFSDRLEGMLQEMRERYDYIFIDCPPIEIVADATIVNKFCDMTVFVVRSGLFDKNMLNELQRNYEDGRYNKLVLILNGTSDESNGYGYRRYGYGYGYGYSYGYGNQKKS